jgi:hypothetical protein
MRTVDILERCGCLAREVAPELPQVRFFDELRPGCFGWVDGGDQVGHELRVGLCLHEIAAACAAPDQFFRCVLQVALHETSHVVDRQLHETALCYASMAAPYDVGDAHDVNFARRALHLWYRAVTKGWEIPLEQLLGSWFCHMPQEQNLLPCLIAECDRLRNATFEEIQTVPTPAGFSALWAAGLEARERWERHELEANRA